MRRDVRVYMRIFVLSGAALLLLNAAQAAEQITQQEQHAAEASASAQTGPLASISNPPSKMATANVKDSSGTIVGAVQRVEIASNGTPTRVDVALIGKKDHIVSIDASQLTYDAQNNEILAQASAKQLRALPNKG